MRIPITLFFRDGEIIVASVRFDHEPTKDDVQREAIKEHSPFLFAVDLY